MAAEIASGPGLSKLGPDAKSYGIRGDNCPYCHLCRKGEIKRRKRKKIKALKVWQEDLEKKLYKLVNLHVLVVYHYMI